MYVGLDHFFTSRVKASSLELRGWDLFTSHTISNVISLYAYYSDHRGTGPLKTTMDVIDAAKVWGTVLVSCTYLPLKYPFLDFDKQNFTKKPLRSNCWYSFFYIFVYKITFLLIVHNLNPLRTLEVQFFTFISENFFNPLDWNLARWVRKSSGTRKCQKMNINNLIVGAL